MKKSLTTLVIIFVSSTCFSQQNSVAPRNLFNNPYNKSSAHHRPIGTGAIYASDDDSATLDWLKLNGMAINDNNGWGCRVAQSGPDDPLVTVALEGAPVTVWQTADIKPDNRGLPVTLRIPEGFSGGTTSDALAVVYDPETGLLHEFYRLHLKDGQYTAALHYVSDIKGLGYNGPGQPPRTGVTASGISGFFGLLRGGEVNVAGHRIQHVLQLAIPRRPDHKAMMLSKEIVWPASSRDRSAGNPKENLGHIPYGSLLAIPTIEKGGPDLDALGLSEPGKRVAEALRYYGAYVVDGAMNVAMRADQFVTPEVHNMLKADLAKVYKYIRLVKNNGKDQTASGGGNPIVSNNAFDASHE